MTETSISPTPTAPSAAPVTWVVQRDDDGRDWAFPSVTLGELTWAAHHSVSEGCSWVDGHLVTADDTHLFRLDVVAIDAPDDHFADDDFDLAVERAAARDAWLAGTVAHLTDDRFTLIAPVADLRGDVLGEILVRWRP